MAHDLQTNCLKLLGIAAVINPTALQQVCRSLLGGGVLVVEVIVVRMEMGMGYVGVVVGVVRMIVLTSVVIGVIQVVGVAIVAVWVIVLVGVVVVWIAVVLEGGWKKR